MDDNDFFLVIDDSEAGQRLDKILPLRFGKEKSRSYFQYLIEQQKVCVNGEPVKKRFLLQAGDEIEVQFICLPELSLTPEPIHLDILYEDEWLIAVNKPAGMIVHPAAGNWSGTFVNALLYHCQEVSSLIETAARQEDAIRPGIVHRLDKNTTGILLAAKNAAAHEKLSALFAKREIYKEYRAVCVGNPGNVTINFPIGRDPSCYKKMAVVPDKGKRALTVCKTLAFNGKLSTVSIELITGRTHQIRVHLQALGTPVLGDPIYGFAKSNQAYRRERQMLHAYRLRFTHPFTNQLLELKAPIPEEMEALF